MLVPANRPIYANYRHFERDHVRRWSGDFAGAVADFASAGQSSQQTPREGAALWSFVARCEAGARERLERPARGAKPGAIEAEMATRALGREEPPERDVSGGQPPSRRGRRAGLLPAERRGKGETTRGLAS